MDDAVADLAALRMERLREERIRCRRALEVAHLRSRQPGGPTPEDVARLRERTDLLTEELIRRYASDLDLVDSLLLATRPDDAVRSNVATYPSVEAYPHKVGSAPAPAEGGAVR